MDKELEFITQPQEQDNWCWAANAASIAFFYDPRSVWTQCSVANSTLGRNDCCLSRKPNPCDESWYLDKALATTNTFHPPLIEDALQFATIQQEIDARRIIGVRIEWANGDGHFISINGYNTDTPDQFIYVADPIYKKSTVKISNLVNNYHQAGSTWTHTYLTKAALQTANYFTVNKNLLQRALQIKPGTEKAKQKKFNFSRPLQFDASNAHEIYLLNFASLGPNEKPSFKEVGFRVLDLQIPDEPIIADFENPKEGASLEQVIHDSDYIRPYQDALKSITAENIHSDKEYELRLIRSPELKTEALWLHNNEDVLNDHFIPLSPNWLFSPLEFYTYQSFFAILKSAASKKAKSLDKFLGG